MSDISISIIIPAYNRVDLLRMTLDSVLLATNGISAEIIVVDDGSESPIAEQLADIKVENLRFLKQDNQGPLFARLTGLAEARGRYIQFLDSDDLILEDKFRLQIEKLESLNSDICYCDVSLGDENKTIGTINYRKTSSCAEFTLTLQPQIAVPLFRRAYLVRLLEDPIVPPHPIFGCCADDAWFYYNLSASNAAISKVEKILLKVREHEITRLSANWEGLGLSALALMQQFVTNCPLGDETAECRSRVGQSAFVSWRKLPIGFPQEIIDGHLEVWKRCLKGPPKNLGGKTFHLMALMLGCERAGKLFRRLQAPQYEDVRTVDDDVLNSIIAEVSQQYRF